MKKSLIMVGCLGLAMSAQLMMGQGKGKGGKGKGGGGNAMAGQELFEANCSVCHNSANDDRKMGPGLKTLFKREKLVNDKPVNDANVIEFINAGGAGMPAFGDLLSAQERADLIAYLHSLSQ